MTSHIGAPIGEQGKRCSIPHYRNRVKVSWRSRCAKHRRFGRLP